MEAALSSNPTLRRDPPDAGDRPTGLAPSTGSGPIQDGLGLAAEHRPAGFGAGLFPVRSQLLRESLLVSFPPLNNMLKFSGSQSEMQFIHLRVFTRSRTRPPNRASRGGPRGPERDTRLRLRERRLRSAESVTTVEHGVRDREPRHSPPVPSGTAGPEPCLTRDSRLEQSVLRAARLARYCAPQWYLRRLPKTREVSCDSAPKKRAVGHLSGMHSAFYDSLTAAKLVEPQFMFCRPSDRRGPWNNIPGPQCAFKLSMFMCPAVHTSTRVQLRFSSTHEPSDPPFRVIFIKSPHLAVAVLSCCGPRSVVVPDRCLTPVTTHLWQTRSMGCQCTLAMVTRYDRRAREPPTFRGQDVSPPPQSRQFSDRHARLTLCDTQPATRRESWTLNPGSPRHGQRPPPSRYPPQCGAVTGDRQIPSLECAAVTGDRAHRSLFVVSVWFSHSFELGETTSLLS
ncbi:hypothetical protein J6590_092697 [Homalodisca vitripennis]|nr:hypothetical protein J6590_092697 [Homalodisca vitripennis]